MVQFSLLVAWPIRIGWAAAVDVVDAVDVVMVVFAHCMQCTTHICTEKKTCARNLLVLEGHAKNKLLLR